MSTRATTTFSKLPPAKATTPLVKQPRRSDLAAELDAAKRLQEVSMRLIQAEDIDSLYQQLLETAVAIMRSDFASIQMLYPERGKSGELRLLAHHGFTSEAAARWEWVRASSRSSCAEAMRKAERVIVPDVAGCEFMTGTEDLAAYLQAGIRSMQSTPLISRSGASLGMISTHWRVPHEPAESELRTMDVLARQAADLIERAHAEQALREREQQARQAREFAEATLRTSPVPLLVLEKNLRVNMANEAFYDVFRVSRARTEGRLVYELGNGQWDIPKLRELLEDILPKQTLFKHFEVTHEFETIGPRTMLLNARRMDNLPGAPERIVLVIEDISDRKKTELASAALAAIVESSDDAIISKDLNGVITSWNKGAERVFGYKAEQAIGQSVTMLMPPERVNEEPGILERIRRGESIDHYETVRRRKDGKSLDISLTVSPVRDSQGRVIGASKIARDITDRKQTEEALRESEERFRMLADNMSQLAWTCDLLGNVTWYNQRWLDYTGMSFEEMKSWGWKKVQHPDHVGRVVERVQRAQEAGEIWEDTFPLRSKEGEYRWFLSRAVPIRDAGGKISRWFGTNTDITDQMRTEDALRKADRLAATGQLAAAVAHEINNPMQALTNLLSLLTYKTALDKDAYAIAKMAESEVGRMAHITKQMLAFHRDSATPVPVRMTEVLDDVLELLAVKLKGELRVEREYEFAGTVEAFPGELRQAFLNLFTNAAEATQEGSITLRLYRSRDWKRPDRHGVRVVVADSGVGIPAANRRKIFEPFFTTKQEKGTGLGLWVVRDIVQRHGGRVALRSRTEGVGSGTVFSVFLPLKAPGQGQRSSM